MERLLGQVRVSEGSLQLEPLDPVSWEEALRRWPKPLGWAVLWDSERLHTRQQEKFWHGVVVPLIEGLWMNEMGWAARPAKGVVHGKLVELCFGMVDTPEGPTRRSSTGLTLDEYRHLIDYAAEYLERKYRVRLPSADQLEATL